MTSGTSIHTSRLSELRPETLYSILRLRVDVFVVEQRCPYRELDGRDLEAGALLMWAERAGEVVATLRLLPEGAGRARIGRVVTARTARSSGLATLLMGRAIELAEGMEVVLDAQSHLEEWYSTLGFLRCGEDFMEDGIAHVPMRRVDPKGIHMQP